MPAVGGFVLGALGIGGGIAFSAAGGAMFAGWVAGAAFGSTLLGGLAVKLLSSVALSALSIALQGQPDIAQAGLRTSTTLTGGTNPEAFILGTTATSGASLCAPLSHSASGLKTPNAYMTYAIELGGKPGQQLDKLILDGEYVEILEDDPHPDYGKRIGGRFTNWGWIKYYDGTQTAADPMMLSKYGPPRIRPWTPNMIGTGLCYALVTFRYHRETYQNWPSVRFVLRGIPLYDPRQDSTQPGGSGSQRWDNPATWVYSANTAVQIYNILKGISLPNNEVWGANALSSDLPTSWWATQMDICDSAVSDGEGGQEPQFKTGLEVFTDDEPFTVIEQLLKCCNGKLIELGGTWRLRVGLPELPSLFITDEDIIVDENREYMPFPAPDSVYNGITAMYPDPNSLWETQEAPPKYNLDWEIEDGNRRLLAALTLQATSRVSQVIRVMDALIKDHRRFRRHIITLAPDAGALEPGDLIAWTSEHNFYNAKQFEIVELVRDPRRGVLRVVLREVDPEDYDPPTSVVLPSPIDPSPLPPEVLIIYGFGVQGTSIVDSSGNARIPALRISWEAEQYSARGLTYQIRMTGTTGVVTQGSIYNLDQLFYIVSSGLLPNTSYDVRVIPISDARVEWTNWQIATTPDTRISRDDLADDILDTLDEVGGIVDQVNADLAAISADVDLRVQSARDDLGDDIAAVEQQLTQGLAAVDGRIETGIEAYDLTVQGQFAAVAGEIADLTAALTSADLIQNGDFATGDMSYWTATGGGAVLVKATSSVPLVRSAPTDYVRQIVNGGRISQHSAPFTVSADDRFQVRLSVAGSGGAASTRQVDLSARWLDGAGNPIGSVETVTLAFPVNSWQVVTHQFDPPNTAVRVTLTFANPGTANYWLITGISASTVNVEVLARVIALEAAQATTYSALSTFQTTALARFGATDAAVSTEAAARASADGALSDRLDTVETQTGTNAAAITAQQTALTNAEEAITQLDQRMVATFGQRQLVRDPVFDDGLTFWAAGSLGSAANLITRDTRSEFFMRRDMPARRAFSVGVGASGNRATGWYDCAPGEVFAISAHFFQQSNAPSGSFWVQFQDASGASIPVGFGVKSGQTEAWHIQSRRDVIAPAGAVKIRALISRGDDGIGSRSVYLTNLLVERLLGFEFMAAAEFIEVQQAQADADGAFSAYVSSATSRFNGIDGTLASHATALSNRYTRAEADAAMASATSGVTARTNRASASGLMRVTSVAAGSDALTRIGLMAEASNTSTGSSAALYLDARSSGVSQVSVVADRFAVVSSTSATANRSVPFYVAGGVVYMDTAVVRDLSVTAAKIGNNALYVPYNFSRSDVRILTSNTKASPQLIYNQTLTVFEGGGFLVSFDADLDALGANDTFGSFYMQVNGVEVSRSKYGARTASGDTIFIMPVSLIAACAGGASMNVKVWAYSSHWENDANPSKEFWLRNISLSISGSRK